MSLEKAVYEDLFKELVKEEANIKNIFENASKYLYIGFDPLTTFNRFLKVGAEKGRRKQDIMKDALEICFIGVVRGTSIDKKTFLDKCSPELQARLTLLKTQYELKGDTKTTKGPEILTVARIMAVFPEIVAAIMCTAAARAVFTVEGLPIYFSFPGAPSVMSKESWDQLNKKYMSFMIGFSKIVNPQSTDSDDVIENRQRQIALAQRSNPFNTQKMSYIKASVGSITKILVETGKEEEDKKKIEVSLKALVDSIGK